MQQFRSIAALLAAGALTSMPSCGIYGGGGGGPKAAVRGNIEAVFPDTTGRDIVVIAYRIKDGVDDCEEPALPENDDGSKQVVVPAGETEFEIPKVPAEGSLVIVFLLDNEGDDADGKIDEGDPIAILDDPSCELDIVAKNSVVTLEDVRLNFTDDDEDGFPDAGRAEADTIDVAPEEND